MLALVPVPMHLSLTRTLTSSSWTEHPIRTQILYALARLWTEPLLFSYITLHSVGYASWHFGKHAPSTHWTSCP